MKSLPAITWKVGTKLYRKRGQAVNTWTLRTIWVTPKMQHWLYSNGMSNDTHHPRINYSYQNVESYQSSKVNDNLIKTAEPVEWSQWISLTNPECKVFYKTIHFMQSTFFLSGTKKIIIFNYVLCPGASQVTQW